MLTAGSEASLYKKHKLVLFASSSFRLSPAVTGVHVIGGLQDGVLVENMHDVPYLRPPLPPDTVACMARVCAEVKQSIGDVPVGVQILAGMITKLFTTTRGLHECKVNLIVVGIH